MKSPKLLYLKYNVIWYTVRNTYDFPLCSDKSQLTNTMLAAIGSKPSPRFNDITTKHLPTATYIRLLRYNISNPLQNLARRARALFFVIQKMGLPYSKEIDAAFGQVTPLVAAGFRVLQKTKNIAIIVACIQGLTAFLLSLILLALLGLLYTMNLDLEDERQQLVTPVMQWVAQWLLTYGPMASWLLRVFVVVCTGGMGLFLFQRSSTGHQGDTSDEENMSGTLEDRV